MDDRARLEREVKRRHYNHVAVKFMASAWRWLGLFCSFLGLQYSGLLVALEFSDVSDRVRLGDVAGKIAAFADFNSDKATDFLVLNSTG